MARMKTRISKGFTLIELMVVVAIIGILAAVAIPAFMKNAKKAKTTEAVTNVKKLYEGARAYYMEEMNGAGSIAPIAHQFPETVAAITPALNACCPSKCAPAPTLWTNPSWQALKFSMDDPHYFSYGYVRNGTSTGGTATHNRADGSAATEYFFADAHGDLNCDNSVYSTFEMLGVVQADQSVSGQAGIFRDNELE